MIGNIVEIARLYLKTTFSSRGVLATQLLMPLLFTYLIGQAIGFAPGDQPTTWTIQVANEDNGRLGALLLERLESNATLDVVVVNEAAAVAAVEADTAVAALIIPATFSQSLLAGEEAALDLLTNPEQTAAAQLAQQAIVAATGQVAGAVDAAAIADDLLQRIGFFEAGVDRTSFQDEALIQAHAAWINPPIAVSADQETRLATAATTIPDGIEQSSPGMMVMFAMFLMMGGAVVLIQERERGTLRRLMVMPIDKTTIILGKMGGILATGLVQMAILIICGALLFGVAWGQSPLALALMVVAFGLAITSLGMMLAALARTAAQANALATVIVLSLASLGGAWWPLEVVPPFLQTVGRLTPVAWAMSGFHDIITRGLGLTAVLPEVGVLLGFTVLFLTVGIVRFRYE
ncbi:MAG: ABC transporter permease [Chloroflexota bacterium]